MTSNVAYQPQVTPEKMTEIKVHLQGYWMNDVWNVTDDYFKLYGGGDSWSLTTKRIDFTPFCIPIRQELKFFVAIQILTEALTLTTVMNYSLAFNHLGSFLDKHYPKIDSFIEISYTKGITQYRTFLADINIKTKSDVVFFNSAYKFLFAFYDTRDEFEKDIWDVRNIPNARFTINRSSYLLKFDQIHPVYRKRVKDYFKFAITSLSQSVLCKKLRGIRYFLEFLRKYYPDWNNLIQIKRTDIEKYLIYFNTNFGHLKDINSNYLWAVKDWLEYLQRSNRPEAPVTPVYALFFKEDFPKKQKRNENEIKYIPDTVMNQLEMLLSEDPDDLNPPMKETEKEYIPIVILLMATGWRASDILNLRYHNCLVTTSKGLYLQGDIPKTEVMQHRVPIDEDVATIIQTVIEQTKDKSTKENNLEKYLFVRTRGKRKGKPFSSMSIQEALNRWAKRYNIMDQEGNIYHFGNHAFRHTKGVELINLGMNLTHVMKWFAHSSPEMTLIYARIADDTLRKEWKKAQEKKGPLLRVNLDNGQVDKMNMDEDLIHWEYIRSNIEAVRVPLGYCLASKKEGCPYVVTPCLTCPNFCTTPDNLLDFEREIQKVEEHIEMTKNYPIYNDKTKEQLDNLIKIRDQLAEGKSHRGESVKKILLQAEQVKASVIQNEAQT